MAALKWFGTTAQIAGVFALSSRLIGQVAPFVIMLAGSASWLLAGAIMRERSILALNAAFTLSNVIGIWRWAH